MAAGINDGTNDGTGAGMDDGPGAGMDDGIGDGVDDGMDGGIGDGVEARMDAGWPAAPRLRRPRILRQEWRELTFLHWAVDPTSVAHFFPPGTRPDTFDGRTYVGLVPFRMVDTGFPHGPAVPHWGTFLETNIRLYSIDTSGRRGVVFLSLDANRLAVVIAARTIFGLPYRWARMTHVADGNHHTYTTTLHGVPGQGRAPTFLTAPIRRTPGRASASITAAIRRTPGRAPASATVAIRAGQPMNPGPLEDFLTARWGLHTHRARRTWYLPNHHPPWPLHTAELVTFDDHGVLASVGLPTFTRPPDHIAYTPGVPAEFGLPFPI